MPVAKIDPNADPLVSFTGKGTIYRGISQPWKPGTKPMIPASHAAALAACGHAADEPKRAPEAAAADDIARGQPAAGAETAEQTVLADKTAI